MSPKWPALNEGATLWWWHALAMVGALNVGSKLRILHSMTKQRFSFDYQIGPLKLYLLNFKKSYYSCVSGLYDDCWSVPIMTQDI